ncbi:MAG: hypothetical protein RJA63_909 [Pseudomonadota bacterium]|jgi:hypothetical protein
MNLKLTVLEQAKQRLLSSTPLLHHVPELRRAYAVTQDQLSMLRPDLELVPLRVVIRVWWAAYCIERSTWHASLAKVCRRWSA